MNKYADSLCASTSAKAFLNVCLKVVFPLLRRLSGERIRRREGRYLLFDGAGKTGVLFQKINF